MAVQSQFIEMFGNPMVDEQKYPLKRLGDCCVINPKRSKVTISDSDPVSFVPMPSVSEEGYLQDVSDSEYGSVKKGFTYFENGDVLFAKITPCMENGKGAIAHDLTNGIGMGSTEFHVLRPIDGKSNSYWLFTLTKLPEFREKAAHNMSGTGGQQRVRADFLENFMIGLPPIELQNDLESICRQADKSKFDGLKSQFIEQFSGENIPRYELSSLCSEFLDGDWIESKDQSDAGYRLVQTGNVGVGEYIDKSGRARFVSEETFKRLNCTEIYSGDILFSRLPEPLGRCCIIPEDFPKAITAVDCTIARLNEKCLPEFLVVYTATSMYSSQVDKCVTGTTRQRISRNNLAKISVPCPSRDEQIAFVKIVRQADKSKYLS